MVTISIFLLQYILYTECVSETGDFRNVMNSKCFHLFSFNTYEHNVCIKEFRFFQFQFNPFNNLTHWKQKSYFQKITSFRWPPFRSGTLANFTHYSLKHLHKNSFNFLPNSIFHLLNCVGCWSFEDLRFQIPPKKEITCWKTGWSSQLPWNLVRCGS